MITSASKKGFYQTAQENLLSSFRPCRRCNPLSHPNEISQINTQIAVSYDSGSGFRDAFSRIMGSAPSLKGHHKILKAAWIDTQLGPMVAIADEQFLYLLEFVDRRGLEREVERLRHKMRAAIIPGHAKPLNLIKKEITQYFDGQLKNFNTPFAFLGTLFQQKVWQALQRIPYGETASYAQLAKAIGNPSAFRAVAQANGANQLSIIIPCHRVINTSGELGGYGGGISRKQWLLNHERKS